MRYDSNIIRQWLSISSRNDTIEVTCEFCSSSIVKTKRNITESLRKGATFITCSRLCGSRIKTLTRTQVTCQHCKVSLSVTPSRLRKTKFQYVFCSASCSAIYHNTHKITGNRRSKLETWLETALTLKYPLLVFKFNDKETINSELDIYIPSLNIAFELNGIFHYEPIYGSEKLQSIQNNDDRKFQACLEHGIELCIIDTAAQKRFTEQSSQKYLEIIVTILESKLARC